MSKKETYPTWIVALHNSEESHIFTQLVIGETDHIKDYMLKMHATERQDHQDNDDGDWDFGPIDRNDIQENPSTKILESCASWPDFNIIITARPADLTPKKHLYRRYEK